LQSGFLFRALRAATGVLCSVLAAAAFAQHDPAHFYGPRLVQEGARIAAPGGYTIAATLLRPEGPGPFGAVVLTHGVPVSDKERAGASSTDLLMSAAVFARRGYVVVLPLRRGFGATGGDFAEDTGPCSNPNYMGAEQAAADDVMAAYLYARALPYVDPNRMLLAGHSAGGMVSVFTAGMRQPEGLVAVLAFAAGRGGNPSLRPGVPCAAEPLARVLDTVGRSIKVPVMFHYAENDLFFNPDTTRFWFKRFTAGGARAEYVLQPPFGEDGHYMFGDLMGMRYWVPAVESFLAKYDVPFQRLDSQDPSHESLLAVQKLPHIQSDGCKGLYRVFLEAPGPRAYAVSQDGRCGFAGGMSDARDAALRQCAEVAKGSCALYAVDDAVVWSERSATASATLKQ